jgi:multicomponent Na+:H+ antiporter subunit E
MNLRAANASGGLVWLWTLLTFVWFAANSSLAPESLATGAVISAGLAYYFARNSGAWREVHFSFARLQHFVSYTAVFVVALVRANIDMMGYVFARRIDVRPGVVEIKTRLRTPVGRLALANSIALTPGSLVVDLDAESLYVHWLDVKTADPEQATQLIAAPFERHLEQVFG